MQWPAIDYKILLYRSLRFVNDSTGTCLTNTMKIAYFPSHQSIDLAATFADSNICLDFLMNCHVFYLDPEKKMRVYLGIFPALKTVYISYLNWSYLILQISYRCVEALQLNYTLPTQYSDMKSQSRKKCRERSIKYVKECLTRWKNLHHTSSYGHGKSYSSLAAAREIGISKKTLEDYSRIIKAAEELCFDFEKHKNDKIGSVRNFVKQSLQSSREKQDIEYCENNSEILGYYFDPDIYWAFA